MINDSKNGEGFRESGFPEEMEAAPETETDSQFIQSAVNRLRSFANIDNDPEPKYSVSTWDIACIVISIICRIISIIFNISVAVEYYRKPRLNYFAWTTTCIVLPLVITTLLCIYMYIQDRKASSSKRKNSIWEVILFVIIFPFLFRYCQSLSFAISSKRAEQRKDVVNQRKFYEFMIQEESDVALIRIFECFLEAAPQKVLQISIILSGEDEITWRQFAAITSCFVSLAWCMVVYHKYNRFTQPDKEKLSICGSIMQCLWHFFVSVSRVLCIAIIASIEPLWTLASYLIHAFFMAITIFFFDRSTFCSNTVFHSFAFSLILGAVYIFTYIMLKDGQSRYRFTFYYLICGIENFVCVVLFILYAPIETKHSPFFVPLCVFPLLQFFVGIIFMILYYTQCHPNILAREALRKQLMNSNTIVVPSLQK